MKWLRIDLRGFSPIRLHSVRCLRVQNVSIRKPELGMDRSLVAPYKKRLPLRQL